MGGWFGKGLVAIVFAELLAQVGDFCTELGFYFLVAAPAPATRLELVLEAIQLFAECIDAFGDFHRGLLHAGRYERDDSEEEEHLADGRREPTGGSVMDGTTQVAHEDQASSGGEGGGADVGEGLAEYGDPVDPTGSVADSAGIEMRTA